MTMFILGLTGSIGMGKSTTAKMFAEEGVPVHDADAVVHRLYDGEAAPLIEAAFPGTTAGGKVDRTKLAAHLVAHPAEFRKLEAIVHPLVRYGARSVPRRGPKTRRRRGRARYSACSTKPPARRIATPSSWCRRRPMCSAGGLSSGQA